jgi:hypothetical protein
MVSKSVLEWREGDPITAEHRNALAADVAAVFHLSKEKEASMSEGYASSPDSYTAAHLVILIAKELGMNASAIRERFPTITSESTSVALKHFLKTADEFAKLRETLDDSNNLKVM